MYFTDGFSFFFLSRHSGWRTSLFSRSMIPEEENRAGREARRPLQSLGRSPTLLSSVSPVHIIVSLFCVGLVACLLASF